MSPGLDVTVPDPATVTVRVTACSSSTLNVAVQLRAAASVTLVVCELPPQAPLQLANVDPLAGAAVSVTSVPVS